MLKRSENFEYYYFSKTKKHAEELHLFFFHGFGADALNVASLHEVLDSPKSLHFYFVEGPEQITFSPGFYGRAWWPLSLKDLEDKAAGRKDFDLSEVRPTELDGLRMNLTHLIETELELPWEQVIVAGFSQGGMLATDLFLSAPKAPKGLMIFSGALMNRTEWAKLAQNRKGASIFLCHGNQDPVLQVETGKATEKLLREAQIKVQSHYFNGAHEISWAPIRAANEYLARM